MISLMIRAMKTATFLFADYYKIWVTLTQLILDLMLDHTLTRTLTRIAGRRGREGDGT